MTPSRFLLFSLVAGHVFAAAPTPPPPPPVGGNLIVNGGFEQFASRENLWDGVDGDGSLAGERSTVPAVTEEGSIGDIPMPMSVNFVDVNGDGLPDLVGVDAAGFFRAYFNSGTKTEPKFTNCEIIPLYLSRENRKGMRESGEEKWSHTGIKLNLADWGKRGLLDLCFGNYLGDIGFIPNTGTASAPEWRQPRDINDLILKMSKEGHGWGNLFAPFAFDWNHDGKLDLLIGEGSYSANAIHLLLNEGVASRPVFNDETRSYLAFGDGKEQLVPAVVDANGDGQPDLVVGDRRGNIGLYLNPGSWKPGTELPFSSQLTFGRSNSFNGDASPYAADWNGDGLWDLIVGKSNGRIAVAVNTGSKEQPKFDTPFEVKGTDVWNRTTMQLPANWTYDSGATRGNLYSYITCVDAAQDPTAQPQEGTHCLRIGYNPPLNKVFKPPLLDLMPNDDVRGDDLFRVYGKNVSEKGAGYAAYPAGTRVMVLHNAIKAPLKNGSTFQVSFKVKGRNARDGRWMLNFFANVPGAKSNQAERGGSNETTAGGGREANDEAAVFTPGPAWTTITKTFSVRFKDPLTKDLPASTAAYFEIRISPQPYEGVVYIDDVQLVQRP